MNWATILVLAVVAAAFLAIIIHAAKNKRKGKTACACGGGCDGCSGSCRH